VETALLLSTFLHTPGALIPTVRGGCARDRCACASRIWHRFAGLAAAVACARRAAPAVIPALHRPYDDLLLYLFFTSRSWIHDLISHVHHSALRIRVWIASITLLRCPESAIYQHALAHTPACSDAFLDPRAVFAAVHRLLRHWTGYAVLAILCASNDFARLS